MISQQERALLSQAAAALKIKDVVLNGSKFEQDHPLPKRKAVEVEQQQMEAWRYRKARVGKQEWLQVLYVFGARLVKPTDAGSDAAAERYYTIEAEFVAHYQFDGDSLSEEAIKLFAKYNAKHNVWPFWREYVFTTCQRARVNAPEIALYSGPCE